MTSAIVYKKCKRSYLFFCLLLYIFCRVCSWLFFLIVPRLLFHDYLQLCSPDVSHLPFCIIKPSNCLCSYSVTLTVWAFYLPVSFPLICSLEFWTLAPIKMWVFLFISFVVYIWERLTVLWCLPFVIGSTAASHLPTALLIDARIFN